MSADNGRLVLGYLELRKMIGALAIVLPILLAGYSLLVGSVDGLQVSLSRYYATDSRDLLVGILSAIAVFMFIYKGYDQIDDLAGDAASLSALGVAFFPSNSNTDWVPWVHFIAALLLLLTLSGFCLFLFPKSSASQPTSMKLVRNRVYYACGVAILLSIALIGVYYTLLEGTGWADDLKPVFWLESLAIWSFGSSWFVKGEGVLAD